MKKKKEDIDYLRKKNRVVSKKWLDKRKEALTGIGYSREFPTCEACQKRKAVYEIRWHDGPNFFCGHCVELYKIEKKIARPLV